MTDDNGPESSASHDAAELQADASGCVATDRGARTCLSLCLAQPVVACRDSVLATCALTISASPQCGHEISRGVRSPSWSMPTMVDVTVSEMSFWQFGQRLSRMDSAPVYEDVIRGHN